ncbi:hypothetical protein BDW62DRAFT_180542 [Aspergillus aurantiobrunneus]
MTTRTAAVSTTRTETEPVLTTPSNTPTSTASITTAQTTATPTSMPETTGTQPTTASTVAASNQNHINTPMIGGIVGGVIGFLLIICLAAFLVYHSKRKRGRRFTLLHWRCPRLEHAQTSQEEGNAASTAEVQDQGQPAVAVGSIATSPPNDQSQRILEENPPDISPLQGHQTNSPPSASSPSPIISPKFEKTSHHNNDLKSGLIARPPDALHPAFREHKHHLTTAYSPPNPTITEEINSSSSTTTTPELSDTGFYRGRLELPASSSRELINVPFSERERHKQQKQLYRAAGLPSPIITPDGAILSANFNGLPVDPDSHATSFMDYDSASREAKSPPAYRSEWRRGSREVKEMVKERFRRKS